MMQVKRYVAPTFAEALIQAKHELGTDAIIVETKKLKVGGFFGLFGRQMTEVTFAIDQPGAARAAAAAKPAPSARPAASPPPLPRGTEPAPADGPEMARIERELSGLRTAVSRLLERSSGQSQIKLTGYGRQTFERLLAAGVDEAAALDIGQRLRAEGREGKEALRQELARLCGPGAPIEIRPGQRRVIALVGPTGVGKTTTLAKLAARFALEQGLSVALVTSDTFRIAAIEQLRTYADILSVPIHAVDTPADMAKAMKETAQCDLVLVDTGGRNHRDKKRMEELRDLLAILRPDETHLVYSLTMNPRDAVDALDYYLPLGVNRLLFTKLDEASTPGLMLNLRIRCNHPISYIADGQSVPDNLLPADQADFTKLLLGA